MNSHIRPSCLLPTPEKIRWAWTFPEDLEVLCLYPLQNDNSCFSVWLIFLFLFRIQTLSLSLSPASCKLFFSLTFCLLCFTFKLSVSACLSFSSFHTLYFDTHFIAVISHLPQLSATKDGLHCFDFWNWWKRVLIPRLTNVSAILVHT